MTTGTATGQLTTQDLEAGYRHDEWLGHGYLGERRHAFGDVPLAVIQAADEAAVAQANSRHWTPERFFEWLNSRDGRWYADETLFSGNDPVAMAHRYVR